MSTAPLQNSHTLILNVAGGMPGPNEPSTFETQIQRVRESLQEWNGESESRLEDVSDFAWRSSLEIARDMFACHPKLELMVDPSEPSFPFVAVEILRDTSIELKAWLAKINAWHERVRSLFPGPFNYPRLVPYYTQR